MGLYRKVKDPETMRQHVHNEPFAASDEDDEAMQRQNEFRGRYIHVTPGSWSLETAWAVD